MCWEEDKGNLVAQNERQTSIFLKLIEGGSLSIMEGSFRIFLILEVIFIFLLSPTFKSQTESKYLVHSFFEAS